LVHDAASPPSLAPSRSLLAGSVVVARPVVAAAWDTAAVSALPLSPAPSSALHGSVVTSSCARPLGLSSPCASPPRLSCAGGPPPTHAAHWARLEAARHVPRAL